MKGITITSVAILLALYLSACSPSGTVGERGERNSAGGLNVAQDNNRPVTGANDVKQPVKDVQQPVKKKRSNSGSQAPRARNGMIKAPNVR